MSTSWKSGTASARPSWGLAIAIAAVALCAAALLALNTSGRGVGLSPDSVDYLSAADCLREGEAMLTATGETYATWPPLYPVVLAGLGALAGASSHEAARLLAVVAMFALVSASGWLSWLVTGRRLGALFGCLLVICNADLVRVFSMAHSEALFTVLATVLAALLVEAERRSTSRTHLFLMILVGAALCLQRYVGVAFVLAGGAALAIGTQGTPRKRAGRAAVLVLGSLLPLFAWAVRIHLVTGYASGHDRGAGFGGQDPLIILQRYLFVTGGWVLPGVLSSASRHVAGGFLIGCCATALALSRRRSATRALLAPALMLASYLACQLLLNARFELDGIGPRQLAPVAPLCFVVVLGLAAAGLRSARAGASASTRLAVATAVGLVCIHVPMAAIHLERRVLAWSEGLVPFGYELPLWSDSDVVRWVASNPPEGRCLSNDSHGFYFCSAVRSSPFPELPGKWRGLARQLAREGRETYVLWFEHNSRSDFPARYFEQLLRVEEVFRGNRGAVYRLRA